MMFCSSISTLVNYIRQIRYSRHKKSICGLSSDFTVITWVSYVMSILSSSYYYSSVKVVDQYIARFPVHPDISVSGFLFVLDIIGFILVSGILMQQFVVYKRTMNEYQGISSICICFIILQFAIFLWLVHNVLLGKRQIYLLDIIDYIWFISKLTSLIKSVPQITVNWSTQTVTGIHESFLLYEWISIAFLALSKLTMDNNNWFKIPVNYNTWLHLIMNILFVATLQFQKDYLYYKPNIPALGYLKT